MVERNGHWPNNLPSQNTFASFTRYYNRRLWNGEMYMSNITYCYHTFNINAEHKNVKTKSKDSSPYLIKDLRCLETQFDFIYVLCNKYRWEINITCIDNVITMFGRENEFLSPLIYS